MTEAQILTLFPTPMYIINLEPEIKQSEIKKLLNIEKDQDALCINERKNYFTRENDIFNKFLKPNSNLEKSIKTHVDYFAKEIFGEGESRLKMHLSWVNFNPPGTAHHRHIHPNSIVSGVFYVRTNEKSGNFNVHKNEFNTRLIRDQITNWNQFNYEYYYFTPRTYDLYLFPSSLAHSVDINESQETRVSLSFNTFYEGEIRTDQNGHLSSLKIGEIETGTDEARKQRLGRDQTIGMGGSVNTVGG
jgi:uncharacterized protein (TIGR02466 family)